LLSAPLLLPSWIRIQSAGWCASEWNRRPSLHFLADINDIVHQPLRRFFRTFAGRSDFSIGQKVGRVVERAIGTKFGSI